jgi:hypothetical protein
MVDLLPSLACVCYCWFTCKSYGCFLTEGDISAMGRSLVIFNKDQGGDRFACANIEPDKDIIKYANIRKPPRFVV